MSNINQKEAKGKLDLITFIYGVGAAIVLVGAMFKFLGWNYANEMFIVGLTVEAIVFLISAFERKVTEKEYQWEQVFPQLDNVDQAATSVQTDGYQSAMQQFSETLKELNNGLKEMTSAVNEIKAEMRSNVEQSSSMKQSVTEFNSLMTGYNENLKKINEQYNEILKK
jgi:gliding motility-associated protein GldL